MNEYSFIRWAGSKKKLIPRLKCYWDATSCQRYIEPFSGSAALFFAIAPPEAVLADMNSDLINMYITVQKHWRAVYNQLQRYELGEKAYYAIRAQNDTCLSEIERAARFIYLNRFCFNGLYRTNKNGDFNVPYAAVKSRALPSYEETRSFASKIKNVTFISQDFRSTLDNIKANDFVYIDPPYAVANHKIFKQYGPATFGLEDLLELAAIVQKLDKIGAFFVVSYAHCPEAIEAFASWTIKMAWTQRTVAGKISSRKKAKEIIISNINLKKRRCTTCLQ